MADPTFVWCFGHATLHEGTWCTEPCVPLAGDTRKAAMADKTARFGAAMELFELAPDQQTAVIEQCRDHTQVETK